jgi:glycine cleavage system H lipoate-binding protein
MKCPFLHEAQVRYCTASSFKKMIAASVRGDGSERCSSPRYTECAAAAPRLEGQAAGALCPFLQDARAEFCGAASVTRYIPANNDTLSRCNSDGHFYCELYLAHADPAGERLGQDAEGSERVPVVDGVAVPTHLSYAPNHMWLDVAEDGGCHVGIDAFLARCLGNVDSISFVVRHLTERPVAVITVNGVDLQMVFPNRIIRASANYYLRTDPSKLTADPYGAGWLFEGNVAASSHSSAEALANGLIAGPRAPAWIRSEEERLDGFAHEKISRPGADGVRLVADGGEAAPGLARQLDRDDLIALYNEFFAPHTGWRRSW